MANQSQFSQSQFNLTQRQSTQPLSDEALQRYVNEAIYYVLTNDSKKLAITRAEINKHVIKDSKRRVFPAVIAEANKQLQQVYGKELQEIKAKDTYMLVNTHKYQFPGTPENENETESLILLIVLSYILMKLGKAKKDDVLAFMRLVGIDQMCLKGKFPALDKLLGKTFISQLYLQSSVDKSVDPPVEEYSWGPRADKEFDKPQVLKFVSKIYGISDDKKWREQWKYIKKNNDSQSQNS